ncbi:RNA polymerase sigma factor [candidate division CSSED10-310 bacterium]|uniref:RNA polymerase sigma factor n=1 Tax=candidate division CSSED10-310 bacterium TaxID=2855610 RepID=A0ABV6YUC6_UNCC1
MMKHNSLIVLGTEPWNGVLSMSSRSELKILQSLRARVGNGADLTDTSLVRQIQAGRRDIVGSLVRQHSDRLYLIIRRMVQSHSVAEDILQDTWVKVVRKIHRYDSSRPILPWLMRIAMNCCRDHWRREKLRNFWKIPQFQGVPSDPEVISTAGKKQVIEAQVDIARALLTLSPKLREVVVMKFYSGLTHNEIADVLRIPPGTVKSRLNYALTKLRQHFASTKEAS